MSAHKKRILVCPLDWGIGHASRCVPIVRRLIASGHEPVIAASGNGKALLQSHFPEVEVIDFPSVQIKYSRGKHLGWKLLWQMPGFIFGIIREHQKLQQIIHDRGIDALISDNRFGCWSKKIPCVYITHQVNLIAPLFPRLLSPILSRMHHWIIRRYTACWIPDLKGEPNLAGKLSHPPPEKPESSYVGLLSRFNHAVKQDTSHRPYVLAILSGPEPQRSLLEEKLILELTEYELVIVRGLPGQHTPPPPNARTTWYNHVDDQTFVSLVAGAAHIICRSGYSTIMDLGALGRTAHLIPTPGQTEQKYLALHLGKMGLFSWQSQNGRILLPAQSGSLSPALLAHLKTDHLTLAVDAWLHQL
ncbi:MAG: glycosyltransferase [Bacteroidetes bacterium]|nr:glycosyltransferase [Bacteroidota bacterium]